MPLTPKEQQELDALRARRNEITSSALEPNEQQELQQLKQKRIEIVSQEDNRNNRLFEQLGGRLPTPGPLSAAPTGTQFLPGAMGAVSRPPTEEIQRRRAFQELTQKGFSPEQIRMTLQAQKILGGPRIGRGVGGFGGAIGATAIAGRVIPGPIDDALIMAGLIASAGAGLGGIAGEATQTAIEEKRMISKREALKAFAIESLTEGGGRAVVGGGKLLFSPFIKKTVPEAAGLVDDFAKFGGQFSPTELDRRFSIRVGEGFARGSFGAKQIFQDFEEKQGKAVLAYADSIINSIGEGVARETPEKIGEIFAEGITRPNGRIFNMLDDLFDPLFKQVDNLAGRAPQISTKTLKKFATKHLNTDVRLNKQFLSPAGRSKLNKILGMNDTLSFSDMRTLRTSFLKDVRKLARDVDQSQGLIKQLAQLTDDAIFDPKAAKGLNPEALNLLRNTNNLYKQAQLGLQTTLSENLAKRLLRNPSGVVKELFPSNPKAIRLLRESLIEPISGRPSAEGKVLWNQLRQAWLSDAVNEATKEGVANPKVFDKIIRGMAKTGSLKEIFPEPALAKNIENIQNLFDIAGRKPPGGFSLFSRGTQALGLAKMYDSGKEGDFVGFTAGSALALGPLAFAKLATTPKGIKFLTAGIKMKPGASGLVPNAVRMVRLLREINRKENKQRLEIERNRRARTPRGRLKRFTLQKF